VIRPDFAKWQQTAEAILRLSVESSHARSRERYLALYMVGSGQSNATQWAQAIGRENATVQNWIHQYNQDGPASLAYQPSGGVPPFFAKTNARPSSIRSRQVNRSTMNCPEPVGP
jgi:transposase